LINGGVLMILSEIK